LLKKELVTAASGKGDDATVKYLLVPKELINFHCETRSLFALVSRCFSQILSFSRFGAQRAPNLFD
jgi:hypothetical protein